MQPPRQRAHLFAGVGDQRGDAIDRLLHAHRRMGKLGHDYLQLEPDGHQQLSHAGVQVAPQPFAFHFDLADRAGCGGRLGCLRQAGKASLRRLQAEEVPHQAGLELEQPPGFFAQRGARPAAHPERPALRFAFSQQQVNGAAAGGPRFRPKNQPEFS